MENNKMSTYFGALVKRSGFFSCVLLSVIVTLVVAFCDKMGVIKTVLDSDGAIKFVSLGLMGVGIVALIVCAFAAVKDKSLNTSDRLVTLFACLFIGLIILTFVTDNGVFAIKLGAALLFLVVAVVLFVMRVKYFDDNEIGLNEPAYSKIKPSALFKAFVVRYDVFTVLMIELAILGVIILNKDVLQSAILNYGENIFLYAMIGISLVCLAIFFIKTNFKHFGISECLPALFLLPTCFFAIIVYAFAKDNKTLVTVGEAFMAFGVVMFAMLLKTHAFCVAENNKSDSDENGNYYKSLVKGKTWLISLAISIFCIGVFIAFEKFDLSSYLTDKLGAKSLRYLGYGALIVIGLVVLFMLADVFANVDSLLLFGDLIFLIAFVVLLVHAEGFSALCLCAGIIFVLLLALTLMRLLSARSTAEEVAEEPVEEIAEETTEEVVEEQAEEQVEEVAEEPVEEITEESNEEVVEEAAAEEVAEEPVAEESTEEVVEEPVEEIAEESNEEVVEEPSEITSDDIDKTDKIKVLKPKKTLDVTLVTATDEVKNRYSALRNALESYGIKSRMMKSKEKFSKKGVTMSKVNPEKPVYVQALIQIRGSLIKLYLNFDPNSIELKYYTANDVSAKTPDQATFIRIRSDRALARSLELIDKLAEKEGFKKKRGFSETDYAAQLSERTLTYTEQQGFGYAIKDTVTYKDVSKIDDSIVEKIVKTQKVEKPERYIRDYVTMTRIVENYRLNEVCDLESLRDKGLVKRNANYVKVKANRSISRRLTVIANEFEPKAVEMICLAGGEVTKLVEE